MSVTRTKPAVEMLNAAWAQEALRHEVENARRTRLPVGTIFLATHMPEDLQNDPAVHAAISEQVMEGLVSSVRASDWKGQVDDCTFVLVVPGLGRSTDVLIVAEGVMNVMDRPFTFDGAPVHIGCSVGVAVSGTHSSTPKGLWQKGLAALAKARALGAGACEEAHPMRGGQMISQLRSHGSLRRSGGRRVSDRTTWTGGRSSERYAS